MKTLIFIALFFILNAEKKEIITLQNQIEIDGEINKQNLISSVEDFLKEMNIDPDSVYVPFRDANNHDSPIHQADVENSYQQSFHHSEQQ